MKKFEVGKSYKGNNNVEITVVRRTEKTVTYTVDGDSVLFKSNIRTNRNIADGEYIFINHEDTYAYGIYAA